MAHRSFISLAPQPVSLSDGLAVPMDIERIDARLRFDALLGNDYDSTLRFTTGAVDGFPVFDLRQTIRSAWLNGSNISPSRLTHEDLGGGGGAEMRVLRRSLPANTPHTLRIVGPLGPPKVRLYNRPPTVRWDGPRLTFRFGFTDRLPGRYLESWIPANLIFDEFDLSIEIRLLQTNFPHVVITTGNAKQIGFNAWHIDFATAYASSPMLEIHAADRVERHEHVFPLPRSSNHISAQIWKETSDKRNSLDRGANIIEFCFKDFSDRLGPYVHDNRFVCMLDAIGSGMEYAGGATADVDTIHHELIHSWWGRGVRPASQSDGWIDEAIATWFENDSDRSKRIDTAAIARKILASTNLWTRTTPRESYSQGRNLMRHLSALVGVERLEGFLRQLHRLQLGKPLTTEAFESFLLSKMPVPAAFVSFHRHVHGLPDHTVTPQLKFTETLADSPWDDPSVWVRRTPDGELEHQPLQRGENLIYVRARNIGREAVPFAAIVARVHQEHCFDPSGVELSQTDIVSSVQFDWKAGEDRLVAIPITLAEPLTLSASISVQFLAQGLAPPTGTTPFTGLAWKAVVNQDAFSASESLFSFCVSNRSASAHRPLSLELRRSTELEQIEVLLTSSSGLPIANTSDNLITEYPFPTKDRASVLLELPPDSFQRLDLIIRLPEMLDSGTQLSFDLVAIRPEDSELVGGIRWKLTCG